MLFERWKTIASSRSSEWALRDSQSGRDWTFGELDASLEKSSVREGDVVFPQDRSVRFFQDVLRGWRDGLTVCPLEPGKSRPFLQGLPGGCRHIKATSASTGAARWVLFNEEQLAADADQIVSAMGLRPDWPNLGVISLAHSYGFSNLVLPLLLHGVPLVLLDSILPEELRRTLSRWPAVTLPAVPALWKTWHDAGVLSSSARLAISAGAPLPLTVENEVFNRSGIKIHNFYGATECGGIAYDPSDQPRADASFAGAAMSAAKPSMTDDGCLEVRGPSVGMGYWPGEDPRLGRGVFRTSDIAEIDGDRIFLRGRAGELIHVAGQKVSPESIESVLAACDGVEACVVFGVASGDSGRVEEIVAVVAPRDGWTPERIRGFALARLPAWQVPRRWWVSPELKANERGKFPRAEWRRRFLEKS